MEEIDKEISEIKLALNARARICAEEFLKNVSLLILYQFLEYTCLSNLISLLTVLTKDQISPLFYEESTATSF